MARPGRIERLRRRWIGGGRPDDPDYAGLGRAPHRLRGYPQPDGSFDYERYRAIQTAGNRAKIEHVFADEATCRTIRDEIVREGVEVRRMLCHGSRNGTELSWFKAAFAEVGGEPEVIGTDISDTATRFPGMVQWDFHEVRDDWVGAFDVVYTNSHDHAYDPAKAFHAWVGQLAPGGRLVVEHTMAHAPGAVNELDPFGVDPALFPYFVLEVSNGRFAVRRMVRPDHLKRGKFAVWLFFIARNDEPAGERDIGSSSA